MEIIVTGRHMEVSDALREYAEKKILEAVEGAHKINSGKAILEIQKGRSKAEIIIHGKHLNIEAEAEAYDMYQAIDKASEKAGKQIEKYLDKVQDHHKQSKIKEELPGEPEEQ